MIPIRYKIHLVHVLFLSMFIVNTYAQTKGMGKLIKGEAPAGTERRVALVIGNKDYQQVSKLINPVNDAEDMGKSLTKLGFDVTILTNADDGGMKKGFREFIAKVQPGDVALFYYSGHGISFGGKNYLLPVDVSINCLGEIEDYKHVESLVQALDSRGVRNSFIFLDACRNLPDVKPCPSDTRDIIMGKGLVKPSYNPSGSMIVYSTAEGSVADDNPKSRNGLFTGELLKHLTVPNLTLRQILDRTKRGVEQVSNRGQSPARYDNLSDEFIFVVQQEDPPANNTVPKQQTEPTKPEVLTSLELYKRAEQAFEKKNYVEAISYYEQSANVGNSEAMNALGYMFQTGTGVIKDTKQAKSWYERSYSLSNQKAAYNLGYMYEFGVEVNIIKAKEYYQKSCDWGDANGCERLKYLSKSEKPVVPITETRKFMDLPFAEMAYIPGGTFKMGDTGKEGNEWEKPVHLVKLDGFYMGKYEITQQQWESIMGSNPSHFKDCPDCPVEQVSWNDVQEFLKKLNSQTGSKYRLPTEAEWEYAAGGGVSNRTRFGNGLDVLDAKEANFDASASDFKEYSLHSRSGEYREKTTKVGSFRSNGLGLYDMSGNVAEWCSDRYRNYSGGSVINPAGPATGTYRVLRGGNCMEFSYFLHVVRRAYYDPSIGHFTVGFRIVLSQ
jgi:formylglycine-generating enzyme required for sulfatase activity/uncharacterized caspase-like protein